MKGRWGPALAPVVPELDPDDVLAAQPLPGPALVAEPAAVRRLDAQAVGVEGRGARLAAQEAPACGRRGLAAGAAPRPSRPPRPAPGRPQHGDVQGPDTTATRRLPRAAAQPARAREASTAGTRGEPGPALTFGAHEAPAHVDVRVVPLPLARGEVARAHDAVRRDDRAAGGQAGVPAVVRDGAAHAAHHFTCGETHAEDTLARD